MQEFEQPEVAALDKDASLSAPQTSELKALNTTEVVDDSLHSLSRGRKP